MGTTIKYKYDKMFRRYCRISCDRKLTKDQFVDDAALLASSRSGTENLAVEYQQTCSAFGLTDSIPKTKHMVRGRLSEESDCEPVELEEGNSEMVDELPYLGSLFASSGRMILDVDKRVAQASRTFGSLEKMFSLISTLC